eukprot:g3257.t1
MKMVPLPKFRTFSVNKPFIEPKQREAILSAFVSKKFPAKKKSKSKKGKNKVNDETDADRKRKNEWAMELKRRKRLRECKELSSQYEILERNLTKLKQDRERLVSLLHYVKNGGEMPRQKKPRRQDSEQDPFWEDSSAPSRQEKREQQQQHSSREWRNDRGGPRNDRGHPRNERDGPRRDTPFPFKRSKSTGYRLFIDDTIQLDYNI